MDEKNTKDLMFNAIDQVNKNIKGNKSVKQEILKILEKRMKDISNNQAKYSMAERRIRYDEILNAMEVVENVLSQKS